MTVPPAEVVQIGTTNRCNARCTFCFQHKARIQRGDMTMGIFERIVGDNDSRTYNLTLFGDPLVDPLIVERVKVLRKMRPSSDIFFHTNGIKLDERMTDALVEAGLSYIVVSCYGLHAQHDRLQPPGKFEEIAEHAFYAVRKMPVAIVTNRVEPMDEERIKLFWGSNIQVVSDSGLEWGDGKHNSGKLSTMSRCAMAVNYRCFDWNGQIRTCCFDFLGINNVGAVSDTRYEDAALAVATGSVDLPFCESCTRQSELEEWCKGVGGP
jgi:hypothetical protein